jgi:WD repeat-containing protein 35
MCWASDNPELLAIMEKGRLVVLRGSEAEEPITSSAWLAGFSDLLVRCSGSCSSLAHRCWSAPSGAVLLMPHEAGPVEV